MLSLGFPIRTSPDHRLLASPRGFSQLATSFVASLRLGIHTHALSSLTIKLTSSLLLLHYFEHSLRSPGSPCPYPHPPLSRLAQARLCSRVSFATCVARLSLFNCQRTPRTAFAKPQELFTEPNRPRSQFLYSGLCPIAFILAPADWTITRAKRFASFARNRKYLTDAARVPERIISASLLSREATVLPATIVRVAAQRMRVNPNGSETPKLKGQVLRGRP